MSPAKTAELATDAPAMAIWRLGRPRELPHHSDHGGQYTSEGVQRVMAEYGVACSLSRSGNVWGNAVMESFVSSSNVERVGAKVYRTRNQAKADLFDYIERFYYPPQSYSTIGYISPMQFAMIMAVVATSLMIGGWAVGPFTGVPCRRSGRAQQERVLHASRGLHYEG